MDISWLIVVTSSGCTTIHGTREVMQEQYDLVTDAVEAVDGTHGPFVAVSGFMDRLDRAAIQTSFKVDEIREFNMGRY